MAYRDYLWDYGCGSESLGQSEAVKCYECSSSVSDDCADPFKTTTTQAGCSVCAKSKVTVLGVDVFTRACVPDGSGLPTGCQSGDQDGGSGEACYCNSDLCNASTRVSVTSALLFLLPTLLLGYTNL
ncbi:protein quiver-like [Mya arenaria]|uniref:protein quiver-like n=1 Tax=Mya arenaria TaxID=6604 RepID=UPI0022E38370|nr:protein quiver-like [Mya arenaria]